MVDRAKLSVACVLGASTAFSLNDVSIKFVSGTYPLHEVMLIRSGFALAITLLIFVPAEGGLRVLRTRRPLLHVFRGMCVVVANLSFFSAIAIIPLAELTAIFFIAPLLITAFSAIFLGETVGIRRWLAPLVGIIGVLLIVRPGSIDMQWAALLPVLAAVAYATLNTTTRNMGLSENASAMSLYIQLTFVAVCLVSGIAFGDGRFSGSGHPSLEFVLRAWKPVEMWDMAIIAGSGVCSSIGGYLIAQAYRNSDAGLVAPFEYIMLVLATVWGFLFWGELPSLISAAGILLILGSGIFVAVREARIGARPVARRISGRR